MIVIGDETDLRCFPPPQARRCQYVSRKRSGNFLTFTVIPKFMTRPLCKPDEAEFPDTMFYLGCPGQSERFAFAQLRAVLPIHAKFPLLLLR